MSDGTRPGSAAGIDGQAALPPRPRYAALGLADAARLPLRGRMALLVLAGALPLLALNLGSIHADYRHERDRAGRQALDLARGLALAVEGELRTRIASLEVLALSRAARRGDLVDLRAMAEAVVAQHSPDAAILLVAEDGQQWLNTGLPADAPLPRRGTLDNQRRVFATGRARVSDLYEGYAAGRLVVAIDVPVRDAAGRVRAVLAMNPSLGTFDEVLRRQHQGNGWIITLLDRGGRRIARAPEMEQLRGAPMPRDFMPAWAMGGDGIVTTTTPEGRALLAAHARLPGSGWGVVVAVPMAELTRPAWRSALTSTGLGLALLLVGLGLAHRVSLSVTRPIAALRRLAAAPDGDQGRLAQPTGLAETDEVAAALREEARRRIDATAGLKDSERRLRLVVAELNHRAKNALATVQALALQTARGEAGSDPARFASEFGARLQTLSRAHDLLTAMSWEPAALQAVVRAGLAPWLDPPDPRLSFHCACAPMPPPASPGQAQAIVLALHELATNAVKHGALSAPDGRVAVTCWAEEDGEVGMITWQESGGPPVPGPPARRGFGTRLLERALARDLGPGAQVTLAFEPGGVRATMRFLPRRNAAAAEAMAAAC
ncbi:sensor histidine kinase [Falsiroseomonas ponticola]|uniref:sensor histidine kinase n=1 Tax=Falsiroseomonas ponticola TaxID=2786951 RepID=UPI0019315EF4|nr:sensor histidine kinase [Roseomonas ponticola]